MRRAPCPSPRGLARGRAAGRPRRSRATRGASTRPATRRRDRTRRQHRTQRGAHAGVGRRQLRRSRRHVEQERVLERDRVARANDALFHLRPADDERNAPDARHLEPAVVERADLELLPRDPRPADRRPRLVVAGALADERQARSTVVLRCGAAAEDRRSVDERDFAHADGSSSDQRHARATRSRSARERFSHGRSCSGTVRVSGAGVLAMAKHCPTSGGAATASGRGSWRRAGGSQRAPARSRAAARARAQRTLEKSATPAGVRYHVTSACAYGPAPAVQGSVGSIASTTIAR